jgi:thiol-disulfide isomerase/thioredoxin
MKNSIVLAISLFLFGCNKIDQPYNFVPEKCDVLENSVVENNAKQNILLEDFTGHTCGNCPGAAIIAENIKKNYGKQIIIVGVHAGFFAKTKTGTSFNTDFTTEASEVYNSTFGNDIAGNPNGFVNRSRVVNNNLIITPNNWETAVQQFINKQPTIAMGVKAIYKEDKNEVCVNVHSQFLQNFNEKLNLVIYFVEDSIVDWQKDYSKQPNDMPDYLHNHVLRDNINGTWGESIESKETTVDNLYKIAYVYQPKEEWKIQHCSIIAYIYNVDTYEIIQASSAYVEMDN